MLMTGCKERIVESSIHPAVGTEDWRYAFATARVRALETNLLSKSLMQDMVNAADTAAAIECLNGTDYAISPTATAAEIEQMLLERRSEVRTLFRDLMIDDELEGLVMRREDFANLRLALRRVLTERPVGTDYSDDGSVSAAVFEEVLEQENYSEFPAHLQEAVEAGVLRYYENKDIRDIDHAIDEVEFRLCLEGASSLGSEFFCSLTRIRIDLTNIRTMLRLKMIESDDKSRFFDFGYVDKEMFSHGLLGGYDALGALFYPTRYSAVVDGGVHYYTQNHSFLRLEKLCEEHVFAFLDETVHITAGPQPLIGYLLKKENEIRMIRMILTAKRNFLETRLILDRLVGLEH